MPTNFTVVPVEDAERDGNSAAAAAGTSKPISLDKIFREKDDEDNLEGLNSGRSMPQTRYLLYLACIAKRGAGVCHSRIHRVKVKG